MGFFFFTLEANITRRCWRRWWFLCKAEVGWPLCLLYQPMSYVSTAPQWCVPLRNEIKALVEMGHPPTSCVCVERTPRVGAVSVDIRVLCACVYMSCQVVAALRACACEGACVLECGLTFKFWHKPAASAHLKERLWYLAERIDRRGSALSAGCALGWRSVTRGLEIIHILYLSESIGKKYSGVSESTKYSSESKKVHVLKWI